MKRRLVAAAWLAGATVPALLATVFIVGCCVLPFHGLMHKLMPICNMAASIMRGEDPADGHAHETLPPAPVQEKKEMTRQLATVVPNAFRLAPALASQRLLTPNATTGFRSFVSLGATRCDQDVGLHALVETYLI